VAENKNKIVKILHLTEEEVDVLDWAIFMRMCERKDYAILMNKKARDEKIDGWSCYKNAGESAINSIATLQDIYKRLKGK
jgi:hypothetical protein